MAVPIPLLPPHLCLGHQRQHENTYIIYYSLLGASPFTVELLSISGVARGVHIGSFAPNPHTSAPPYFAGVAPFVYPSLSRC